MGQPALCSANLAMARRSGDTCDLAGGINGKAMDGSEQTPDLRERLTELQREHRQLDARITEMEDAAAANQIEITRLKKRKLWLKDEIARIEDQIFPDIIA